MGVKTNLPGHFNIQVKELPNSIQRLGIDTLWQGLLALIVADMIASRA